MLVSTQIFCELFYVFSRKFGDISFFEECEIFAVAISALDRRANESDKTQPVQCCGFDHSVANMLYFYCLGEISWRVVGYIALSILGNIIGGTILPLIVKLREYSIKRNQAKSPATEAEKVKTEE